MRARLVVVCGLGVLLGCGSVGEGERDGGGSVGGDAATADAGTAEHDSGITLGQREAAAAATARSNARCVAIAPFYWEIGDGSGRLGSESVGGIDGGQRWTDTTVMAVASASKWFYSTYWVERTDGGLSDDDIRYMNFRSGYSHFVKCPPSAKVVDDCLTGINGTYDSNTVNLFAYGGGHMQKHASANGLGALDDVALASELRATLGADIAFSYNSPQLAGGMETSAAEYAKLLRKIIRGELAMKSLLGTHAVCASAKNCASFSSSPAPADEEWSYSLGHWVESDPVVGDGAFGSAGAFGFYPWIDSTKTLYGVIARVDVGGGAGFDSVKCGRLIRKAWVTGAVVP